MKTAVSMQHIITVIANEHSLDLTSPDSYLRLEQPGLMPLVIEKYDEHLLSIAISYKADGYTVVDPEVTFFTGHKRWVPIEISHALFGNLKVARLSDDQASVQMFNPKSQAILAAFCHEWAVNLKTQGWLNVKSVK